MTYDLLPDLQKPATISTAVTHAGLSFASQEAEIF